MDTKGRESRYRVAYKNALEESLHLSLVIRLSVCHPKMPFAASTLKSRTALWTKYVSVSSKMSSGSPSCGEPLPGFLDMALAPTGWVFNAPCVCPVRLGAQRYAHSLVFKAITLNISSRGRSENEAGHYPSWGNTLSTALAKSASLLPQAN